MTTPVLINLEDIRKVMEACCSSYLKVFVDTEVISIMGETLTDWFDTFGKDVEMIRLTDGNYNGYRIWGRGTLPLSKYLKDLDSHGYEGLISLQIPGEKYVNDPERAFFENRKYVADHLERIVYGSNH